MRPVFFPLLFLVSLSVRQRRVSIESVSHFREQQKLKAQWHYFFSNEKAIGALFPLERKQSRADDRISAPQGLVLRKKITLQCQCRRQRDFLHRKGAHQALRSSLCAQHVKLARVQSLLARRRMGRPGEFDAPVKRRDLQSARKRAVRVVFFLRFRAADCGRRPLGISFR